MRARRRGPKPFKQFASRHQGDAKRRPARISNEERFAAVLVVVLLAALVGSVCFAYFLHRDNARSRTATGQAPQTSPVQRLPMADRRGVRITMAGVPS
jgi:ferric-dicitrate binding protein FerR (iron transport regulator)